MVTTFWGCHSFTKEKKKKYPFETGTVREPLLIVLFLRIKTTKHKTHRNEHQHSTNYSSGVNNISFILLSFSPLWPYLQHGGLIVTSHQNAKPAISYLDDTMPWWIVFHHITHLKLKSITLSTTEKSRIWIIQKGPTACPGWKEKSEISSNTTNNHLWNCLLIKLPARKRIQKMFLVEQAQFPSNTRASSATKQIQLNTRYL